MTDRERQILKEGLIFEAVRGSHAYGTNVEGSDTDLVGIYVQPSEDITGLKYVPQISDENNDAVYYEVKRFFELAMKGNPNILEIFNTPHDCLRYVETPFDIISKSVNTFLTTQLYFTFAGYANSQIKKARGLNKKMNWDKDRVTRKDVLDFCYVIVEKEKSILFKTWSEQFNYNEFCHRKNGTWNDSDVHSNYTSGVWYPLRVHQENIGLAKVNNMPDIYSMYAVNQGGIIGENSNDVRLQSIPKDANFLGYLRFDKNAYSTHCKDYREYTNWVEKRNKLRYDTNVEHGKGYDSKNMMHCIRLLKTAIDIAKNGEVVVRRPDPEREVLLSIRKGEMDYDELLKLADDLLVIASGEFAHSGLPESVDPEVVHNLINEVRKAHEI